jgi:DNA topoisomerase-2
MSLLPYHINVMRFIEDQISDKPKVDLRRRKTEECNEILAGAGYNKIDEKFDYLMKLPVSTFTAESIEKNQRKLDELREEIQKLERTSPAEMWLTELSGV